MTLELAFKMGSGNQNIRLECSGGFGGPEIQLSFEPLIYYTKQFPTPIKLAPVTYRDWLDLITRVHTLAAYTFLVSSVSCAT